MWKDTAAFLHESLGRPSFCPLVRVPMGAMQWRDVSCMLDCARSVQGTAIEATYVKQIWTPPLTSAVSLTQAGPLSLCISFFTGALVRRFRRSGCTTVSISVDPGQIICSQSDSGAFKNRGCPLKSAQDILFDSLVWKLDMQPAGSRKNTRAWILPIKRSGES